MSDESGVNPSAESTPERPKKQYRVRGDKTKAPPAPAPEKGAFGKTCERCGKGLSNDRDALCPACALAAAEEKAKNGAAPAGPAPDDLTFLDEMKNILAEVERQNAEEDKITEEVRRQFRIVDHGSANWAAGKIAMWMNEIERRKRQAQEYIAEAERHVRRLEFLFKDQLEAWAKANIPQDKKSLRLPSATLKFSETQEKIEVLDETAAVQWATVNLPDAVEMKTSLSMLKQWWLERNKENVPAGCQVVPPVTNFKVVP